MDLRFVDAAGIWEVPGPRRPCSWCKSPADMTYVSELADAKRGPGSKSFCNIYCWGQHVDANLVKFERVGEPRFVGSINGLTWDEQVRRYPAKGDPGFTSHSRPTHDVLIFRSRGGDLAGVLYHYPRTMGGARRPGPQTVIVAEEFRGQRIGTNLCREASRRWGIDLDAQQLTFGGFCLQQHTLKPSPRAPR
jgi:hypothetical protein